METTGCTIPAAQHYLKVFFSGHSAWTAERASPYGWFTVLLWLEGGVRET